MVNKKLLFGILAIAIIVAVLHVGHYYFSNICYLRPFSQMPWVAQIQNVSLYDHGKVGNIEGIADELVYVMQRLNLQATCAIFEEDVERVKQEGKIVEVVFKEPVNITISQWIEPEDRGYIPTNASGYRILTDVEKAVFVLRGDYEGHVLTKSVDVKGYGCWAILKDGEIDKSWVGEVEKAFKLKYEVKECSIGFEPERVTEYDEDTKTLTAYVRVNCCGVNVTVEKENNTYKIIEKQYGELCRCMCVRKVTIYNVPMGARVEFVDKDGIGRILTPRVNVAGFCGWSTYGKCNSDEDCIRAGCSQQVCQSKFEEPIGTTCEWLDCYDANKYGVTCECVDGKCQWVRK